MQGIFKHRNKHEFCIWMLNLPFCRDHTQKVILAVYLTKQSRETSAYFKLKQITPVYFIRVIQEEDRPDYYTIQGYSGRQHSISPRSRHLSFVQPTEFKALKTAASFYHRKIHKVKDPYSVFDYYFYNEEIYQNWQELTLCEPCQVPQKIDMSYHPHISLIKRLRGIELE